MSEQVSAADEGINQSFGYKQELRRALRLFSLYAVAFSIISITTGLFANYGFGLQHLGAAMIWLWPVAAAGQMLIALVVAELGTRIPLAGYSYQWGARLVNTTYGWFTGFVGLSYLAVGAAGINFVVVAPIIATILNLDASNPTINLVITVVVFAAVLAVNIISIALASRVNNVAVFTEIAGMVGFGLILFVLWALHPNHSIAFLGDTGGVRGSDILLALPYAALMGIFTIVGFELAADLGEEAVAARVTVPKAVIWSVASSAVLGMVALIGFTIAIPDLGKISHSMVPLVDIVAYWMGDVAKDVFVVIVVFSILEGQPADADSHPSPGDRLRAQPDIRRLGLHQRAHRQGQLAVPGPDHRHGDAAVRRLLPDRPRVRDETPPHRQAARGVRPRHVGESRDVCRPRLDRDRTRRVDDPQGLLGRGPHRRDRPRRRGRVVLRRTARPARARRGRRGTATRLVPLREHLAHPASAGERTLAAQRQGGRDSQQHQGHGSERGEEIPRLSDRQQCAE